jgi:superfamily II DNA or RNA helicase
MLNIKAYVNHEGYNIKKKYLTSEQIKLIEKELTVSPKTMSYNKIFFKMFQYKKHKYVLPRFWAEKNLGLPSEYKFIHQTSNMKFKDDVKLYAFQHHVLDRALPKIKKGGGLISIACGGGKTIMSLYIACQLGLKTLVIVHDTELEKQWKERIEYCTNATVGSIRQKKIDIEGKDIVIGSIQSISKKDYGDLFGQFGFVIYDEAHHVSSKWFSRSLLKTCCKHSLALTATPTRKDGLICVMYWFLGECAYQQDIAKNPLVDVKRIIYSTDDKKRFIQKERWLRTSENSGSLFPDPNSMTINLCKITERNKFLVDILVKIITVNSNRKILILSWLIEHLDEMKQLLDICLEKMVADKIIEHNQITTCKFHGGATKEERKFAKEHGDIIFGTFNMAKEGLDIPRLNTVLFCTTQTDVRQAAGRITRSIPKEGGIRPMIIDFTDDLQVMRNHSKKRSIFYRKSLYNEEEVYAFKNKCCKYKKYMKKQNIKIQESIKTRKNMEDIFNTEPISVKDVNKYIKLQEEAMKKDIDSEDSTDSTDSCDKNKNVFLRL